MLSRVARSLLVAASFLFPVVVGAQVPTVRPTPEQAQTLLQTRPDLLAQLRQRFASSGMTREQVHARLRAEGYPEDLLDPYLGDMTGAAPAPSDDVFRAVRALGIADSADVAQLRAMTPGNQPKYDSTGRLIPRAPAAPLSQDEQANQVTDPSERGVEARTFPTPGLPTEQPAPVTERRPVTAEDSTALAELDSGFTIFGLNVFRGATSQFEPNLAGPVDANYRLGPGDRLVLILTGDVEASYDLPITREGFIVIPQVGQLFVANLTLGDLERVLSSRLSRVYSGVRANNQGTTRFSVSVARLRSNQIYVVGDVRRPGSYLVSSAGTALTALYAAGGPTTNGSLRSIEVRRGGRTVSTLDVYDYLVRGDATNDVRLQTGDVVFVAVHGPRVRVVGEIARPATYELKGAETLEDLIRFAGMFRATAARQRVLIERILAPGDRGGTGRDRVTLDVSSEALVSGAGPKIPLLNGDVVRVFPVAERVRNRITVEGNVYQAGAQGFTSGMRLSQALRRAGVKSDTYLGEVLVSRLRSDSTRFQLRATLADTTGNVLNDIPLQEDDRIEVFSLTTFRPTRYVSIGGAVRRNGRYPFRDGMTLRDLVLLADGVQEGALLTEAEVARLPENRTGGRTAVTIRVPLDSTYLFERGSDGRIAAPPGIPVPSGGAPDVPLRPYDNVLILRQPGWSLQHVVVIQGEVKFPGSYALTNKSERLSDLITRAGGLTSEAYSDGIVFVRRDNALGRVGIELSTALRRYESTDNLILRDGDNISIPPYNGVVTIKGEVNAPSTVAYVRGRGIDYYIGAAGGPTPKADDDHAYVTQPSGKVETVRKHMLLPDQVPRPRPGSVVTVPENSGQPKRDNVALITGLAQIVASTVAIIIAVTR